MWTELKEKKEGVNKLLKAFPPLAYSYFQKTGVEFLRTWVENLEARKSKRVLNHQKKVFHGGIVSESKGWVEWRIVRSTGNSDESILVKSTWGRGPLELFEQYPSAGQYSPISMAYYYLHFHLDII